MLLYWKPGALRSSPGAETYMRSTPGAKLPATAASDVVPLSAKYDGKIDDVTDETTAPRVCSS